MDRRDFLAAAAGIGTAAAVLQERLLAREQSNLPMPGVQILVFDTFGTVVDWRSAVIAEGQQLGREKKLNVDWAKFADDWRAGYGPAMNRVRTGQLPWTKLDVLHRMTLDDLLVKYKIDTLTDDEKVHFNKVWHRLRGWPDSVAGLTRLKKRFVIAPLSNGNVSLLTDMAKFAGLPWDAILSTELVRHYKPDKETYLMPGEFWDAKPDAVMMVAAHAGDLDSAKALGLKTAYVHRPLEYGPGRQSTLPAAGRYDFITRDMKELATQLGL